MNSAAVIRVEYSEGSEEDLLSYTVLVDMDVEGGEMDREVEERIWRD